MSELSKAEYDVYNLLLKGLSNKEIADQLFVCEKTIKFHLTNIYKKFNVKSRHELIALSYGGRMDLPVNQNQRQEAELRETTESHKKIVEVRKENIHFVNEQFNIKETVETLHENMKKVTESGFNHANVNAACNCARTINDVINTAITAAKFLGK